MLLPPTLAQSWKEVTEQHGEDLREIAKHKANVLEALGRTHPEREPAYTRAQQAVRDHDRAAATCSSALGALTDALPFRTCLALVSCLSTYQDKQNPQTANVLLRCADECGIRNVATAGIDQVVDAFLEKQLKAAERGKDFLRHCFPNLSPGA